MKCIYEGCYAEAIKKGFCKSCYNRLTKARKNHKENPNKKIPYREDKFSYDELWRGRSIE